MSNSRTSTTDLRARLRGEGGITIVEAIISAVILLIGLLAGFLALESASDAAKTSERQAVVAAVGQREIEKLSAMTWAQLAHCQSDLPQDQSDPDDPRHYVNQTNRFLIKSDYRNTSSGTLTGTNASGERFVTTSSADCIDSTEQVQSFTSGGVTGKSYRFITWRDDSCYPTLPGNLQNLINSSSLVGGLLATIQNRVLNGTTNLFCTSDEDSKRLTVAVTVDEAGEFGPHHPTWISTIQTNPNDGLLIDVYGNFNF